MRDDLIPLPADVDGDAIIQQLKLFQPPGKCFVFGAPLERRKSVVVVQCLVRESCLKYHQSIIATHKVEFLLRRNISSCKTDFYTPSEWPLIKGH